MTAMSRGLKVVIVAALLPAFGGCHKSAPVPDAGRIATANAVAKFRSVVTASDPNSLAANAFFDAVGVGDADALLAFPVLRPHLDAGFAESADISLSMALAKNPLGVLALLNSPAKLKDICVSKLIEPEAGVERAWYRDAEFALSKIDAKSPLAARRDACLETMRSDEKDARRSRAIAKFWGATTATNQNNVAAEAFFAAVEAGEPDALLGYPIIYQHLSGGGDEAQVSLSMALAKNPSGVLALLNSAAKIKDTCVSNLIEPEPSVERAWYKNAEAALSKIDARSPLAARRDACLETMRSSEQNVASGPIAQVADKSLHFEDYNVSAAIAHYNTRLQLTDSKSREFATLLRQAVRKRPNFAGHFVLTSWGCGASCIMIAAIDRRSGKILWLPFTLCCWSADITEPLEFRRSSSLLILHGRRNEMGNGTYYYNFANKMFTLIRAYPADKF